MMLFLFGVVGVFCTDARVNADELFVSGYYGPGRHRSVSVSYSYGPVYSRPCDTRPLMYYRPVIVHPSPVYYRYPRPIYYQPSCVARPVVRYEYRYCR